MTDSIQGFTGQWAFLSNLYPSPVEWNNFLFPCVENAFQAAKTDDSEQWRHLAQLPPDEAAVFGRSLILRPGWDAQRLAVMTALLELKFEIPALRRHLLATAPRELVNQNWWGDRYWGRVKDQGENHLGRLLMQLRDRLLAE